MKKYITNKNIKHYKPNYYSVKFSLVSVGEIFTRFGKYSKENNNILDYISLYRTSCSILTIYFLCRSLTVFLINRVYSFAQQSRIIIFNFTILVNDLRSSIFCFKYSLTEKFLVSRGALKYVRLIETLLYFNSFMH